jgi:hypothetical protein
MFKAFKVLRWLSALKKVTEDREVAADLEVKGGTFHANLGH